MPKFAISTVDEAAVFAKVAAFPHLELHGPLAELDGDERRLIGEDRGLSAAVHDATEAWRAAQVEHAHARQNAQEEGLPFPDALDAQYADQTARRFAEREEAIKIASAKVRDLSASREVRQVAFTYVAHVDLADCAFQPPLTFRDPNRALREAIDAQERFGVRMAEVRKLPPPISDVKANALRNLAALPATPWPRVGPNGEITFADQTVAIDAESATGGRQPFFRDPLPFFLADPKNAEAVKAHVLRTIEARYVGVNETADAKRKAKLLAELDAKLLIAMRQEVGAIRQLRAAGQWVPFRPTTDPRAILNIEGPAPKRR